MEKKSRVPVASDPGKLTKRAGKVLDAIAAGETLCVKNGRALDAPDAFESRSFWLEPSGSSAAPTAVEELIRKAKIAPNNDGLLDGFSQTWRAA